LPRAPVAGGVGGDPVATAHARNPLSLRRFLQLEARLGELERQEFHFAEQNFDQLKRQITAPTEDEIEFNLGSTRLKAWAASIDERIKAQLTCNVDSKAAPIRQEIEAVIDQMIDVCSRLNLPSVSFDYETPFSAWFGEVARRRWRTSGDWGTYWSLRNQIVARLSELDAEKKNQIAKANSRKWKDATSKRHLKLTLIFLRLFAENPAQAPTTLMQRVGEMSKTSEGKDGDERLVLKRSTSIKSIQKCLRRLGVKNDKWKSCSKFIEHHRVALELRWQNLITLDKFIDRLREN
jgi:hypothetical protein